MSSIKWISKDRWRLIWCSWMVVFKNERCYLSWLEKLKFLCYWLSALEDSEVIEGRKGKIAFWKTEWWFLLIRSGKHHFMSISALKSGNITKSSSLFSSWICEILLFCQLPYFFFLPCCQLFYIFESNRLLNFQFLKIS